MSTREEGTREVAEEATASPRRSRLALMRSSARGSAKATREEGTRQVTVEASASRRRPLFGSKRSSARGSAKEVEQPAQQLHITERVEDVAAAHHMLLYLTRKTWTRGDEESALLEAHVKAAKAEGVHVLLVHEMMGLNQSLHEPCDFGDFFACDRGTTPWSLLHEHGIYDEIATPLRGAPWRMASMVMLAQAISKMDAEEARLPLKKKFSSAKLLDSLTKRVDGRLSLRRSKSGSKLVEVVKPDASGKAIAKRTPSFERRARVGVNTSTAGGSTAQAESSAASSSSAEQSNACTSVGLVEMAPNEEAPSEMEPQAEPQATPPDSTPERDCRI
jgi:hypothetical protein